MMIVEMLKFIILCDFMISVMLIVVMVMFTMVSAILLNVMVPQNVSCSRRIGQVFPLFAGSHRKIVRLDRFIQESALPA
jgi:hypothetical protein